MRSWISLLVPVAGSLVLGFTGAPTSTYASPSSGATDAEPDFRGTRLSISLPERPRATRNAINNLAAETDRRDEILGHISDVFEVPKDRLGVATPEVGDYQRTEWEHSVPLHFDAGYRYCRTRVYEYHYFGHGAAAMDAGDDHIDVLAYLHPGALRHPTFFRIELELLTVREDLAGTEYSDGVCLEPLQPFYQRFWGDCC